MKRTRYLPWPLLIVGTVAFGGVVAFGQKTLTEFFDAALPDTREIAKFHRRGTITILSSDGRVIQKLGPATREKVEPGEISLLVKQAFIAAEDRRFYSHNGVDLWGIGRALVTNLRRRSIQEGGSTITQQLARMVFLSQDRTLTRKLKEAALALKLERQLSKRQILGQYLNYVYLGSNAYGVADAAWVYYSKRSDELTLPEIALIAGLPPAPSVYSPLVNPDLALQRRAAVLDRMQKSGFITIAEETEARNSPLALKPATPKYFNSAAPYFTSWVAQRLPQLLSPEQLEVGGLRVHTSLNLGWQHESRKVVLGNAPASTEGAMVSIEPETGLVRVMIGGRDFSTSQFNRATQALRSPGSTFKLFPYAAAITAGVRPETIFVDSPRCWHSYCPKNFDDKYLGEVSLADALKNSLNTVAVQLLDRVGFDIVINTANQLGIGKRRPLGKFYPMAIGAYEQTVLNMTAAYAAVANRGIYVTPTPFEEIRSLDGEVLWSWRVDGDRGYRALDSDVADVMNWMLQQVVSSGTGIAAKLEDRPVAGKTGTSEGARDLWFIGSVPQLTTAVWFGCDDNKETESSSGEAAWAWKKFMSAIKKNLQVQTFPPKPVLKRTYKPFSNEKPSLLHELHYQVYKHEHNQEPQPSNLAGKELVPESPVPVQRPRYVAPPDGPPVNENFEPLPVQW